MQPLNQMAAVALHDAQGYVGELCKNSRSKSSRKNCADRGHKAQHNAPRGIPACRLNIVAHLLDLPDEPLGPVKKHATCGRQEHAASVTDKKLHPKLLLKQLYLPAKPGLGDPETIRRLAKASELRNRPERT